MPERAGEGVASMPVELGRVVLVAATAREDEGVGKGALGVAVPGARVRVAAQPLPVAPRVAMAGTEGVPVLANDALTLGLEVVELDTVAEECRDAVAEAEPASRPPALPPDGVLAGLALSVGRGDCVATALALPVAVSVAARFGEALPPGSPPLALPTAVAVPVAPLGVMEARGVAVPFTTGVGVGVPLPACPPPAPCIHSQQCCSHSGLLARGAGVCAKACRGPGGGSAAIHAIWAGAATPTHSRGEGARCSATGFCHCGAAARAAAATGS